MLFRDLESQWVGQQRLNREGEINDMKEAEAVEVSLQQRLLENVGQPLKVYLINSQIIEATLVDCAPEWLLLGNGLKRFLVPFWALKSIPVSGKVAPSPNIRRRLSFNSAIRMLAQGGYRLRIVVGEDSLTGRVNQVSADHILLKSEPTGELLAIPLKVVNLVAST